MASLWPILAFTEPINNGVSLSLQKASQIPATSTGSPAYNKIDKIQQTNKQMSQRFHNGSSSLVEKKILLIKHIFTTEFFFCK